MASLKYFGEILILHVFTEVCRSVATTSKFSHRVNVKLHIVEIKRKFKTFFLSKKIFLYTVTLWFIVTLPLWFIWHGNVL